MIFCGTSKSLLERGYCSSAPSCCSVTHEETSLQRSVAQNPSMSSLYLFIWVLHPCNNSDWCLIACHRNCEIFSSKRNEHCRRLRGIWLCFFQMTSCLTKTKVIPNKLNSTSSECLENYVATYILYLAGAVSCLSTSRKLSTLHVATLQRSVEPVLRTLLAQKISIDD